MGYSRCFELSMCIFIAIGSSTSYDCCIRVPSISHGKAARQPRHTNATVMAALASDSQNFDSRNFYHSASVTYGPIRH
eukprot:6105016-Pleurochrysis_carterae.AAC.1